MRGTRNLAQVWLRVSGSARELITGLLEKDPAKRYTLQQTLDHPWVKGEAAPDTIIDKAVVTSMYTFTQQNKFRKAALKLIARCACAATAMRRVGYGASDRAVCVHFLFFLGGGGW